VAFGDVADGSRARGDGSGGDGEDAAWLDLVARYDAPVPAQGDGAPWPEREDLGGPVRVSPADAPADDAPLSDTGPLPDVTAFPETAFPESGGLPDGPPFPETAFPEAAFPERAGFPDGAPFPDAPFPDALSFPRTPSSPAGIGPGRGPRDAPAGEDPADDHYIPPPAPPLPKLNPVTKGAWLALFGGPLYLIIATVVGWTVSGLAAFIAVAAFIGGFAVLVLRMDSGPPRGRGPDDGAVI
jgi:hypothetical protein